MAHGIVGIQCTSVLNFSLCHMHYIHHKTNIGSIPWGVHHDLLTLTGDFFSGLGGEDSMAPPTIGVVRSRWCLAPALLDLILGVGILPLSEGKSWTGVMLL